MTSTRRILLVEHETAIRESVKSLLEKHGSFVVGVNNGAEALITFRQSQFDLVVCRQHLPLMSGDEMAERIRALAPNQQVVIVETYPRNPAAERRFEALLSSSVEKETQTESASFETELVEVG